MAAQRLVQYAPGPGERRKETADSDAIAGDSLAKLGPAVVAGLRGAGLQPEAILGGTREVLARAVHGRYVADQQKLGHTPADNPSMVPWDELPQTMRDSSRDNADHMLLKLAAVGCSVELLTDAVAARFQFTQQEVEQLAIMEHQRWADERLADGWTCAPGMKDAGKKTSPYLVPRKSLSEEIREYDRVVVMGIPLFLAGAGFQVRRLSPAREQKTASLAAPSLAHD